ncbi:hypothetical protein HGO75_25130, partial [Mycobacterium tuberculosis]|nr:hypothetical protein [Mycobacterium tuberculosis]
RRHQELAGQIITFIDELHTIVGAGAGQSYFGNDHFDDIKNSPAKSSRSSTSCTPSSARVLASLISAT